jgi:hypothetical protein
MILWSWPSLHAISDNIIAIISEENIRPAVLLLAVGIMSWFLLISYNWPLYTVLVYTCLPNATHTFMPATGGTLWAYVGMTLKFSWNRSVLKLEASLSKTLVSTYRTTWLYKPEDHKFLSFFFFFKYNVSFFTLNHLLNLAKIFMWLWEQSISGCGINNTAISAIRIGFDWEWITGVDHWHGHVWYQKAIFSYTI